MKWERKKPVGALTLPKYFWFWTPLLPVAHLEKYRFEEMIWLKYHLTFSAGAPEKVINFATYSRIWAVILYKCLCVFSGHLWVLPFHPTDKQQGVRDTHEQWLYDELCLLKAFLQRRRLNCNEQINTYRADLKSFDCTVSVTGGVLFTLLYTSKSLRSEHKRLKYETDIERNKKMDKLLRLKWII